MTYIFNSKNSSGVHIVSAESEDEAWEILEEELGSNHNYRLSLIENE